VEDKKAWLFTARKKLADKQYKEAAKAKHDHILRCVERNKTLARTNPRAFNRKIMRVLTESNSDALRDPDTNTIITNSRAKMKVLSKFWKGVMTSQGYKSKMHKWPANDKNYKSIKWNEKFTLSDFNNAIGRLFSSPGTDGISTEVVKSLPDNIKMYYLNAMNNMYGTATTPEEWRTAMISLLPKTSQVPAPGDFRPIALLPVLYKVYTGMLTVRLENYVDANNILYASQYGSRAGKGTAHAISHLVSVLEDAKQHNKKAYICSLDIRKAFDSVEYGAIFDALKYYKVDEHFITVIKSLYLDNKCFIASPEGDSNTFEVTRGVRQGDTLSPLLFALVVNLALDFASTDKGYVMGTTEILITSLIAYCDDITLIAHSRKDLQRILNGVSKWLGRFGLVINPNKTFATSNTSRIFSLLVNSGEIHSADVPFKFLGIWIDPQLDWSKAIKAATNSFINKLNKVKYKRLSLEVKSMVVNIMCNKALEYTTAFTGLPEKLGKKIAEEAANVIKRSIPARSTTSTKWVYASKKVGGVGIDHPSTSSKVALVSTFLRILRDMDPSPATTALRIRVKDNIYLNDLGKRDFRHNSNQWAKSTMSVYSDDDWTTKYVKIMESHNMITLNNTMDTSLVIDGVSLMQRKTWISAGISLDTPWADLFVDRVPKSRKQLWKEGFHLTLNEYMSTIAMVLEEGALAEHLNQIFTMTAPPMTMDPRNDKLEQFTIDGSIFKNTVVFTDGSAKDGAAGWGVFFKEGSKFNSYGKVVGQPNNFIAELEAIEYALNVAPTTPFLTIITDSEASIKAITAATKASPRQLAKMNAKDTLARLAKAINSRASAGSDTAFLHVYSHQQDKIKVNPNKWVPLITKSNNAINFRFPGLDYIRGNDAADQLAEKGRLLGVRQNIIPEGLEDFVVVFADSQVPLENHQIKRSIISKDVKEWDSKAQALVSKDQEKWWTNKVSHEVTSVPQVGAWLRRARLHNRTTTTLLHQNTSKSKSKRLQHVANVTSSHQCPMPGCDSPDTQDHIFYCKHSRKPMSEVVNTVNRITETCSTGLTIEAYWIPGVDRKPPKATGKPSPRLKWGSLGLVPKQTWKHLVAILGEKKAKETALKINLEVVKSLYEIDLLRTARIKDLINADRCPDREVWEPT
jgi:ribonuclease HI